VSGYPDFEATEKLLRVFEQKGVAAVELGIPFSDPLADGHVIQKASKKALENGVNPDKIFEFLKNKSFLMPLILFTYYNPVLSYGEENFVKKAAELNISGIIIPDLPLEESEYFKKLCTQNNINFIMLVSPTSDEKRIEKLAKASSGFVYLVSSTGVTGVRENFSSGLENIIKKIKNITKIPVAVGFGVSEKKHIQDLKKIKADAVIIGSAIIKIIDKYHDDNSLLAFKISEYLDFLIK